MSAVDDLTKIEAILADLSDSYFWGNEDFDPPPDLARSDAGFPCRHWVVYHDEEVQAEPADAGGGELRRGRVRFEAWVQQGAGLAAAKAMLAEAKTKVLAASEPALHFFPPAFERVGFVRPEGKGVVRYVLAYIFPYLAQN